MATVNGVGGDERVRVCSGEGLEARGESREQRESERESRGSAWRLLGSREQAGRQVVACGGRARVGHALCIRLAGGRRPPCPWWAGPARWAAR